MNTVSPIHVSNLSVDEFNPRRSVDSKAIVALADNIHQNGVLSPLLVRPTLPAGVEPLDPTQAKYTVLCGSRRLQAAQEAGLTTLPCVVRELTDQQAAELALTEQNAHESLTVMEVAEGVDRWMKAGAAAEEVAQRMGKKRAWIYSTANLVHLTPEAKRAVNDKRIPDSTAKELATVPASAQGQVLKRLLEPSTVTDGPLTTREARDIVASFRRDLTHAPFDPEDSELQCVEHAGPCSTCPFRSGFRPDLFDDNTSPNLCTSPKGYASKADADWARRITYGETNRAPKCLLEPQTDKYFNGVGQLRDDVPYVEATAICYEDMKQRTYAELLGKSYQLHVVLARVPKKLDVIELIGKEGLEEKLGEAGKWKPRPGATPAVDPDAPKLSAEEKREAKKKAERTAKVVKKTIAAIVAKVEKRELAKADWARLADSLSASLEHLWERRDVQEGPERYLARLDGPRLVGFIYEAVREFDWYRVGGRGRYSDALLEDAKAFGVDVKEVEREVVAEERVQPEVKKAETKKKGKAA